MRRRRREPSLSRAAHPPSPIERLIERVRGREQLLVRPTAPLPLLLLTFPRGQEEVAHHIETLYAHELPALPAGLIGPYTATLARLPVMVVLLLRPFNPCGCLGHCHPTGMESRLTRRLAGDLGGPVAEIDLAFESLREWRPRPLSALAAEEVGDKLPTFHFDAALLAVLLHEFHHLAFPEADEREVREKSNQLYEDLMRHWVVGEGGHGYGMVTPS